MPHRGKGFFEALKSLSAAADDMKSAAKEQKEDLIRYQEALKVALSEIISKTDKEYKRDIYEKIPLTAEEFEELGFTPDCFGLDTWI